MNLSFLSVARFRMSLFAPRAQVPHVPTNEDRLRALRAALASPPIGNAYAWPHKGRAS